MENNLSAYQWRNKWSCTQCSSFLYADPKLLTYIILLLSKESLWTFLARQPYQQQIPSIFVCLGKSLFHLHFKGWLHNLQNSGSVVIFSQHFIPFFSCLHGFRGLVRCSFCYSSSLDKVSVVFAEISSSTEIFSSVMSCLPITPSKLFFTCTTVFLICSISFQFLLRISISLLQCSSVLACCILYPLEPLA